MAHTARTDFGFTWHRQAVTHALRLEQRRVQVPACTKAQQRWVLTRHQWRLRALVTLAPGWAFAGQQRDHVLMTHRWSAHGVFARLVRLLRQRGWATVEVMQADLHRWGGEEATRFFPNLAHHPLTFVQWQPDAWTVTPWVRLEVPFTPSLTHLPGATVYERAAAEFWIHHQHIPEPEEEWHSGVRQVVQEVLSTGAVPICFEEHSRGEFQQTTLAGVRRLRLIVERLPDGLHFTRVSALGEETYSVTGRAFVMDGVAGVQVVTAWASRRWQEALRHPDDQPGFIWHPVGLQLRNECRAAKITPWSPGESLRPLGR
ncbi:hypothetical protein K7W42_18370 [Deinococcus sp. HMF7604]|uniref:hypothetical protein n=1 Tax=Deinococcus betulae TaxID=2873312 RepID=UPI001CCCAB45|nr:hypothetical protein [Deinococcus betulae]MBZ9752809.1 hypothetical protein [Deinococcus betulae]